MIEIEKCLKVIKSGGIILYPTDTIYGLGCDAYNLNAIRTVSYTHLRAHETDS